MISRARSLCVLISVISSSAELEVRIALEELRCAENGLQRIVQFMGDAGNQQADRGEPLLADHLPLERLDRLAQLPSCST